MINFLATPIIETERLILRRFEITDAQRVFDNWLSDERVSDNRINPAHKTVSETIERLEKIVSQYGSKKFCYWGFELKANCELIGEIDFTTLIMLLETVR